MAKRPQPRASGTSTRKRVRRSRADQSLLLRSAESLGRVIGALERQLERAQKKAAAAPPAPQGRKRKATARKK